MGRGLYGVLVLKLGREKKLERPRRRWGDNIKMDLQEIERGCMNWIDLARDRERWRVLVNAVINLRIP
jgi:hypothetical protein